MSDSSISLLHIQKLGHKIEEIRIRALNHIISKFDNVTIKKIEFSRYLQLLKKLFEWFDLKPLSEEEKILNLILRIFKSDVGLSIIKHVGAVILIRDLKEIYKKINKLYHPLMDQIIQFIESISDEAELDLKLVSEVPLSYRSQQSVQDFYISTENMLTRKSSPRSNDFLKLDITTFRTNSSDSSEKNVESTAHAISGIAAKSSSLSGLKAGDHMENVSPSTPIRDILYRCIPFVTLNWQPLVKSDTHVLKSVEDSLQKPPDPQVLLHSCDFFCNVILQDFPAEVFLQKPAVLMLFYDMIQNSPSTRITNAALNCLNKLTENLITRIRYYNDPSTFNLKQGTSLMDDPDFQTPNTPNSFSYNFNVAETEFYEVENDCVYEQIILPQYCVKTFQCVLNYVSEKPQSFKDSTNKNKTQSGINVSLRLIDKLVVLINLCIKPEIWNYESDSTISEILEVVRGLLNKLGDVLEQYRLMVVATDMEYFERMAQLHLLHSTSYLLNDLVPITKCDAIIPRSLKTALSNSLLDSSFSRLYPVAHESLLQFVNEFHGLNEVESLTKYNDLKIICIAMSKAIKILKSDTCFTIESLQIILDSLPSLEFHKNLSIINTFFKICIKNNSVFIVDDFMGKIIEEILLKLLSHSDKDVRKETYYLSHKLIVNILGLNHTKHMNEADPGSQIMFFFQSDILMEITIYGLTSDCIQIQTEAEDILIHILKCKFVVSEAVWKVLMKGLMPVMPFLQCFANNKTPLGKAIVRIMDPDISTSLFISNIDILKGNLRMLFCKDVVIRNEAVSRLCWLLTTEPDAFSKIPKIRSLNDCGLANIFQIEYPLDLSRKRNTAQFYQISSLQQVLDLLSTKDIEPSIRRSALTQMRVMLEDHFMHSVFLEQNGLKIILEIFHNCLFEKDYHNYPDSVVPIISILKSVALHNPIIRQELSLDLEVIFNVLRGLFLYCTDKRIQNDGLLLCVLLLFSEFSIYSRGGNDSHQLSLPEIITKNLNIPIICHTHWKTSKNTYSSLIGLLMSDDWCKSTLRMHWNIEWFGGITELITWPSTPSLSNLTKEQLAEFSVDLRLTKLDLLALKASSINHCCKQYLYDIENATTHQTVTETVRGLSGYITLWLLTNKSKMYNPDDSLLKLDWEHAFCRFLSTPPANSDDDNLLIEILRCLTFLIKLFKNSSKNCWISDILQNPNHYLSKLLQIDATTEQRPISFELLSLITDCSVLEQHLLDISSFRGSRDENTDCKTKKWIPLIQTITENLKYSDTEQFYNLAYLDKLLSCLVQITSNLGWSEFYAVYPDYHKIFTDLIAALSELLTNFHYGKGSEAASSFMGLSITRNALLIKNHILYEMQNTMKKNWEVYWVSDTVCNATLFSLFSLWACRDVIVRAATLQLLAGLALSPRGATLIVENVRQKSGGVWETAIAILIDQHEASIVREQAAILLTNLSSHINVSPTGVASLPLCHAPLTSNKKASGMDTVLTLLYERNVFEEIDILLACLHLETTFEPSLISIQKSDNVHKSSAPMSVRSYVQTTVGSASPSHNEINIFSTPSFVKNTAEFINNLLCLAPEKVSEAMADFGLVKGFFRCLAAPSLDLNESKNFLLYTDTLEMSASVCALLTRSVLINNSCRTMALHTRDCLHVLVSLLNPYFYNIQQPHLLYLRNNLWSEIFKFLTALLETSNNKSNEVSPESYNVLTNLVNKCGHEPFFKSICESIESKSQGLQKSALQSLTSLLNIETILPVKDLDPSLSLQNILDNFKSPRETSKEDLIEQVDFKTKLSVLESYHGILENQSKKNIFTDRRTLASLKIADSNLNLMMGADLCKILLKLFELQSVENNKDNKRKGIIIGALSSLLNASEEAKKCALKEDLLSIVFKQLKNLLNEVSLHSAESLHRISDKKKVCPILKEVDGLFCLVTNFIIGNETAKNSASKLGLADITHKFWVWFCFDRNLLINIMKLLCTFTTNCKKACQSLTLTNAIPGTGPRKIATNLSILNAVIILINKEMDLVSKFHDVIILQLSFHVLKNVCCVPECRNILTKSSLFQSINRLHPSITKKQRPWETVEAYWLEFLEIFSFYPEGQIFVTKVNDILEILLNLANAKGSNKYKALCVLRNVSFHHLNRIKLLATVEFIQLLHNKLTNGTNQEKNIVVSIIWALVANSQRSKMAIKCAGLDTRIEEILKQYEMQGINDKAYQTMLYVSGVLKEGEK